MHPQGSFYVPKIISTDLTSKHHNEGTLASKKLENSLPENTIKTAVANNT